MKKISCPVCESTNISKIFSATDYLVSNKSFDIVHCTNCSLRITHPSPKGEDISKYYNSEEYISHKEDGNSFINKIYKIVQRVALIKKRKIVETNFGNKKGRLLDIGCGTGNFLNIMKNSGWQVSGVEPDENARALAQILINGEILSPDQHYNDTAKYDIITMWHSLEHVMDLNKQITQIDNLLKKNGMLFIAVPNYTSLDAKYYKHNWAAYDVPRHLYHFSPKSMQVLLDKYGYSITKYKQLPFDPFYIALLSELSVLKTKNIIRAVLVGFRSYLSGLFSSQKGSSVLYILERKS